LTSFTFILLTRIIQYWTNQRDQKAATLNLIHGFLSAWWYCISQRATYLLSCGTSRYFCKFINWRFFIRSRPTRPYYMFVHISWPFLLFTFVEQCIFNVRSGLKVKNKGIETDSVGIYWCNLKLFVKRKNVDFKLKLQLLRRRGL
jgi:hypothetical protein